MGLVLGMAGGLWGVLYLLKASVQARLLLLGLLYVAVLAIQVALPDGHGVRVATGGSAALWLGFGVLGGLGLLYRAGVLRLQARAHHVAPVVAAAGSFRPAELERYSRQILLREIGGPGQKALKKARILVVGAGGLGSPALLYLAAAGVGTIGVIDDDVVDNSNLQRQVIHVDARIGMPKVFSAQAQMVALNPFIQVLPYQRRLTEAMAAPLLADYDIILDGSDNFDTRYLLNRLCVAAGKPLISAAITQWEGQISLFDPAHGGPCYQCVFPERPAPGLVPTCAEAGVAGPLPGVIGAMMALEAVKAVTGAGEGLRGRLMIYDGLYADVRLIGVERRAGCPVCGGRHLGQAS